MPLRKETMIENAFTVDSIVTILYLKWENADYIKNSDNIYDFWQLLYLDCGHYTFQIGGKTLSLGTGQLMLCEPGKVRHSLDHTDVSIAIISFRCHSAKIDMLKNQSITLSDEQRKHLSHILTVGTERFKTIPENQKYFGQEPEADTADYELQTIKNRLELLLIDMYESRNSPQKVMPVPQNQVNYYEQQFKRIERYMIVNINKNLTISDLSAHIGFSPITIKRICNRQAGCGAIHYFLTLKVKAAKSLIRETDMSLTQISENLGFANIHYFSRIFKKFTGMPPRQYAKSILKNQK
mgnify:CR=1 FL=1